MSDGHGKGGLMTSKHPSHSSLANQFFSKYVCSSGYEYKICVLTGLELVIVNWDLDRIRIIVIPRGINNLISSRG